jgi:hypothetical protein
MSVLEIGSSSVVLKRLRAVEVERDKALLDNISLEGKVSRLEAAAPVMNTGWFNGNDAAKLKTFRAAVEQFVARVQARGDVGAGLYSEARHVRQLLDELFGAKP